ncbi:MAG: hypothetical protein ACHQ4H_06240 [Ktedonobacterales bacterium]
MAMAMAMASRTDARELYGRRSSVALFIMLLVALALLAGCSGSNAQATPGLAGATADHPAAPPQLAPNGPGGTFAFVYDNQIWLRSSTGAKQLTHLVLSNGATLVWGPLAWSPTGKYIAFSLVENLTPSSATRSAGALYYVDTHSGGAFATPGTGSVYGHTYAWLNDNALVYSNATDLMMYDLGDEDPRVWDLRNAVNSPDSSNYNYSNGGASYGDIALSGDGLTLYYTVLSTGNIGGTGIIGNAEVRSLSLSQLNNDFNSYKPQDSNLPAALAQDALQIQSEGYNEVAPLGKVYSDANGTPSAGVWQVAADGGSVAAQQVDGVDTGKRVVSSHFCVITTGYTYCQGRFSGVGKYALGVHAALALSAQGRIAVTTDALYVQASGGGPVSKAAASGWGVAPAWAGDGRHMLATQLNKTTVDAGGVTRFDTTIVSFDGGSNSVTFIGGAMNAAWAP